jgi:hypothetical protein
LGLTKRWLEEEEAIRYYTSDESVCARCFHDREIQRSIQQHQAEHTCSVCNRTSKNSVAAPADKVLAFILERLHRRYENADGNPFMELPGLVVEDLIRQGRLLYSAHQDDIEEEHSEA